MDSGGERKGGLKKKEGKWKKMGTSSGLRQRGTYKEITGVKKMDREVRYWIEEENGQR